MAQLTPAQAQAIADTATKLADKNKPPVKAPQAKPPETKAEVKPAAKPAEVKTADVHAAETKVADAKAPAPAAEAAPAADAVSLVQVTDSRITHDGAVLNFRKDRKSVV